MQLSLDAVRAGRAARFRWAPLDAVAWVVAIYGGVCLRYDFRTQYLITWETFTAAAFVAVAQVAIGSWRGPYAVHHRLGSPEEVADLARTVAIVALLLFIPIRLTYPPLVPTSTPITSGAIALLLIFTMRFVRRAWWTRRARRRHGLRRAVVFGAGQNADQLLQARQHLHVEVGLGGGFAEFAHDLGTDPARGDDEQVRADRLGDAGQVGSVAANPDPFDPQA